MKSYERAVRIMLADMEEKLDYGWAENTLKLFRAVASGEKVGQLPLRVHYPFPYEPASVSEMHASEYAMLYNELLPAYNSFMLRDDCLPMIRANYGVGTFLSGYGVESLIHGGNMPHVPAVSVDKACDIISKPYSLRGLIKKVLETQRFYTEILSGYPGVKKHLRIYHCDLQGPLDSLHLLLGNSFFLLLFDEPDMIAGLMEKISEDYITAIEETKDGRNDREGEFLYHWQAIYKGDALVRDDISVTLSKDMYEEFSFKYIDGIGKKMGGVSAHYCGSRVIWLEKLLKMDSLKGLNIGRVPGHDYNDEFLGRLMAASRERNLPLNMFHVDKERLDADFADFLRGYGSTGISLYTEAGSRAEAEAVLSSWRAL